MATLWQQVRRFISRSTLRLELARSYAGCGLVWQAGYTARQAYRLDASSLTQLQTLELGAWQNMAADDALLEWLTFADVALLTQHFVAAVAQCPGDWLPWLCLARLH